MASGTMYTVYLSKEHREFLARRAQERDLHESNILRDIIEDAMRRPAEAPRNA